MTRKASRPFDFSIRDELLNNPENAEMYLQECRKDGNIELYQDALRHLAKAQSRITPPVSEPQPAGVSRAPFCQALS